MLSRLPASIKRAYDEEDYQFDIYSEHTEEIVAEAMKKGKTEGLLEGKKEGLLEGKKEGLLEGMEKGMEKGKKEATVKVAHEMKKLKIPMEQIVKATGLSAAEIKWLCI